MSDAGEIIGRLKLDASQWFAKIEEAKAAAESLRGVDPTITIKTNGAAKAIYELDGVWAATRTLEREQKGLGTSFTTTWGAASTWFTLIGGLGPALVPVAAGTVGLTAAVGEFGAAAVFAVLGIKNAMAAGTSEGRQFSAMLDSLDGGLHTLEQTAAAGVMQGLAAGIHSVDVAIPMLNGQLAVFSQLLGSTVSAVATGFVNGMEHLAPLLLQSGVYLEHVVAGLAGFTASTAFEGFVQYSVANLPTVERLLNSIVGLSFNLLAALAPLGTVALDVVTTLTTGLAAIPVPVLTGLAAGALAAFGAFKAWGMIGPILNSIEMALGPVTAETAAYVALLGSEPGVLAAVTAGEEDLAAATAAAGSAMDFASGPVGLVVAALGGLAAAFVGVIAGNQQVTAVTTDYTAALQADNGALGANTAAQVANALAKAGAFNDARKLGISQATLTQATLGNAGALHTVNTALGSAQKGYANAAEGGRGLSKSQQGVANAVSGVRTAIGAQSGQLHTQVQQYRDVAAATGKATSATRGNSAALSASTPITAALTAEQQAQVLALRAVAEGFRADSSAAETMANSYDDATIASGQLITSLKASKGNLNEDTQAGATNAEMFRSAIGKIKAHADAINADGKHAEAARAYTLSHARSLETQAAAAGADKGKVDNLVGSLINVSRQHPISKIDVQTAAALAAIANFKGALASIHGRDVTIAEHFVQTGTNMATGGVRFADGGTARVKGAADGITAGYAGTVTGPGNAWNDMAGLYALANGEEVISNKFGQADQWRPLLKAINAGKVHGPGQVAVHQPTTVINRTFHVEPHIHNPVAVDPVQQVTDAAQYALAYASLG